MTTSNQKPPRVSVLLPVYNGLPYLEDAVASIVGQSFADLEIVTIDDGSTDGSLGLLEDFAARDSRIRIVSRENRGLIATLNQGIELCRGEYIARMDADDIAYPERIERQVAFLDANPQIGLCGTFFECFGTVKRRVTPYRDHDHMVAKLLIGVPFAHPTVVIRKSVLVDLDVAYDSEFKNCEDYELWSRLGFQTEMANIPETLLKYRVHDSQVSETNREQTTRSHLRVTRGLLARLDVTLDDDELSALVGKTRLSDGAARILEICGRIIENNGERRLFSAAALRHVLGDTFLRWSLKYYGLGGFALYRRQKLLEVSDPISLGKLANLAKRSVINTVKPARRAPAGR